MKQMMVRACSLLLCVAMLVSLYQFTLAEADDTAAIASVTGANLTQVDTFCTSHLGEQWLIDLCMNQDIVVPNEDVGGNFYASRHLSVDQAVSQSGNTTTGAAMRSRILINGKTLDECIAEDGRDGYNSIHVGTASGTAGNYLQIAVPLDNKYGFNGDGDFTITLKKGLKLNGYEIAPKKISYSVANKDKVIIEKLPGEPDDDPQGATIQRVDIKEAAGSFCTSHGADNLTVDHWIIDIYTDKNILGNPTSYWNRHLQADDNVKDAICSNILLNGKTVSECIALEAAGSHPGESKARSAYTALHVSTQGNDYQVLQLAIPKDNLYGFDANSGFTITIKSGITLNNTAINPRKISYSTKGAFTIEDYQEDTEEDEEENPAPFIEATLSEVSNYENSGNRGDCYLITLKSKGRIAYTENSYWYRNLQQNSGGCTEEHAARANILRQKIIINGISVGEELAMGSDHTNSTMIRTGDTYYLYIHIRKAENGYGISKDQDFTVEIKPGIVLNNNTELAATIFRYDAQTQSFTITPWEDSDDEESQDARITSVKLSSSESGFCTSHGEQGGSIAQWLIDVNIDKDIVDPGIASYYARHLQQDGWSSENTSSSHDIRNLIMLNGKTLDQCISESSNRADAAQILHVQMLKEGGGSYLRIAVPKDNTYGFNGDGVFTISFKEGLRFNGYNMPSKSITHTPVPNGSFTVSQIPNAPEDSANGATVQNVQIQLKKDTFCNNHPEVASAHWLIDIYLDKRIWTDFSSSASYWNRHLLAAQEVKDAVCNNILLNDKTIAQCIAQEEKKIHKGENKARNAYNALHVGVAGSNQNVLQIAIPIDNFFEFNAIEDFSITIKSGITLGGVTINPRKLDYTSSWISSFDIEDYVEPQPEPEPEEVEPEFIEATLSEVSNYDNAGNRGDCYLITLKANVKIAYDENSYWYRNLQQSTGGAPPAHVARAITIRDNIIINGISVDEELKMGDDHSNSTMVRTTNDYYLLIYIRKDENGYGISPDMDFTVEIKSGIVLNNDISLPHTLFTYSAATKSFTIKTLEISKKFIAFVTGVSVRSEGSGFCPSHNQGDMWIVDITVDKKILMGDSDVSGFYRQHLSVSSATSATGQTTVGEAIRKLITINGKDLNACLKESGKDEYNAFHIQIPDTEQGNVIRIAVPKNNTFGFNVSKGFVITLKDGLYLNGLKMNPSRISYNAYSDFFDIIEYSEEMDNYIRPILDWEETPLLPTAEKPDAPSDTEAEYEEETTTAEPVSTDNQEETGSTNKTERQKVVVKKKKPVDGSVQYEYYLPGWAIALIVVGAVLSIGGTIALIVLKKRNKEKNSIILRKR